MGTSSTVSETGGRSTVTAPPPHDTGAAGAKAGWTSPGEDPVQEIMKTSHVAPGVSPEEFMQICSGRILELMKDELEIDAMRRETLAWSYDAPMA